MPCHPRNLTHNAPLSHAMSAEPIATHKQKDVGSIRTLVAHPAECQRDDLYQKNPALYQLDRDKGIGESKPCGLRPRVGGVLATKIPNARGRKPSINPNSRSTPVCPWLPFCQSPNWQLANVLQCGTLHGNRVVPQVVLCQIVFQSVQGSYKQMSCKAAAKKQQAGNLWVAKHV